VKLEVLRSVYCQLRWTLDLCAFGASFHLWWLALVAVFTTLFKATWIRPGSVFEPGNTVSEQFLS
jgi:hypothetical protein